MDHSVVKSFWTSGHRFQVGHWAYGSLDAKIASKDSFAEGGLEFTAVAGPTHDQHPPFQGLYQLLS